jgi:hypothetical protein
MTTLDTEWARAAFDNPRALLPQRPRPNSPPAISETILAGMSKPRPTAMKVGAGGTATATMYRLLSPGDLLSTPLMRDLVKGILPRSGTAAIVGASMAGKGFLVFYLMAVLAESGFWFGYRVDKTPVIYIGLEGAGGLPKRILAWEKHNGRKYPEIRIITQSLDLRNAVQVEALIDAIRDAGYAGGVVVIDTLNQAAAGADENSSRDMSELIAALKHIQESLGGLVIVVHHLGKDQSRGPRGHSSFLASLDASIEVRRENDRRSWVCGKVKDDSDGAEHHFRLQVVEVGTDEDGDPVTSCVVIEEEGASNAVRGAKIPRGGNQKVVYDVAGELLKQGKSMGQGGAPVTRPCIRLDDLIEGCRGRLAVDSDRIPERVRLAVTGLVNGGCLVLREDWLWVP